MSYPAAVIWCLFFLTHSLYGQERAPYPDPPADVSSVAILVSDDEPGERLVINGTVYGSDGVTPAKNLVIYLYQTDASGVYNTADGSWHRPRIQGWVRTDEQGHYGIRTIKPGSYPRSNNPAHIHATVKLPGMAPRWIDDFLFQDDPYLSRRDREAGKAAGQFSHVMEVQRDSLGLLQCRRDIRLPRR